MTVGNVTVGNSEGAFYSTRNWNGSNDPGHFSENPYTLTSVFQRRYATRVVLDSGYPPYESFAYFGTSLWYPSHSSLSSDTVTRCLSRLSEKIRGTDTNFGAALGELPQTVSAVTNTALAVLQAARQVRRGNVSGAVRALALATSGPDNLRKRCPHVKFRPRSKAFTVPDTRRLNSADISGTWLALKYGWEPLMSDVHAAAEWIESKTSKPRRVMYRASASQQMAQNVSQWGPPAGPTITSRGFIRVEYRYYLTEPVSTARKLGLLDPVSIAWELVPFSFVVDWFIPLGNYFELVGLFPNLSGWYATSTFSKASAIYANSRYRMSDGTLVGGGVEYQSARFVRSGPITSALPVPKPSFKAIERVFSLGHFLNASALLHQAIRR